MCYVQQNECIRTTIKIGDGEHLPQAGKEKEEDRCSGV